MKENVQDSAPQTPTEMSINSDIPGQIQWPPWNFIKRDSDFQLQCCSTMGFHDILTREPWGTAQYCAGTRSNTYTIHETPSEAVSRQAQTCCMWCHGPPAPHIQAFPMLLICSVEGVGGGVF